MVDLMSPVTGKLKKNLKEEIHKLKLTSLFDFEPEVKPGEELQQTINLFTEPGCALLVHASKDRIEKDIKVLRAAEHNGFYEVEEDGHSTISDMYEASTDIRRLCLNGWG